MTAAENQARNQPHASHLSSDVVKWRRMQKRVCEMQRRIDDAVRARRWKHLKSLRRSLQRLMSANSLALQDALERAKNMSNVS